MRVESRSRRSQPWPPIRQRAAPLAQRNILQSAPPAASPCSWNSTRAKTWTPTTRLWPAARAAMRLPRASVRSLTTFVCTVAVTSTGRCVASRPCANRFLPFCYGWVLIFVGNASSIACPTCLHRQQRARTAPILPLDPHSSLCPYSIRRRRRPGRRLPSKRHGTPVTYTTRAGSSTTLTSCHYCLRSSICTRIRTRGELVRCSSFVAKGIWRPSWRC